jgi:hypothetical protein
MPDRRGRPGSVRSDVPPEPHNASRCARQSDLPREHLAARDRFSRERQVPTGSTCRSHGPDLDTFWQRVHLRRSLGHVPNPPARPPAVGSAKREQAQPTPSRMLIKELRICDFLAFPGEQTITLPTEGESNLVVILVPKLLNGVFSVTDLQT